MIDRLRAAGQYTVVQARSPAELTERVIRGFTALHCSQIHEAETAVAGAPLAAVAVFPSAFPDVAKGLASGIERRLAASPTSILGADPRRKLRRDDWLVGPALLAQKHGISPQFLALGLAAALHFNQYTVQCATSTSSSPNNRASFSILPT